MTGTVLDERGRRCPLPIIALGRALRGLPSATVVTLIADDPVVRTDVPAWCSMVGATIVDISESAGSAGSAGSAEGAITFAIRLP